jgi:DNA-binding transcriptional ArsR family regulator
MIESSQLAQIAAVIGERGRAQILLALLSGRALTATELADSASVTRPTASSHLARLQRARLVSMEKQGRHRYFRIATDEIAHLLESMLGAASNASNLEVGPKDPALRKARLCYDHLAGEFGVMVYAGLERRAALHWSQGELALTQEGWLLLDRIGLQPEKFAGSRRPMCRACIDWSERRYHLAGAVGEALMSRILELKWATLLPDSRVLRFSVKGERMLKDAFQIS